jgi:hypothetical protein
MYAAFSDIEWRNSSIAGLFAKGHGFIRAAPHSSLLLNRLRELLQAGATPRLVPSWDGLPGRDAFHTVGSSVPARKDPRNKIGAVAARFMRPSAL